MRNNPIIGCFYLQCQVVRLFCYNHDMNVKNFKDTIDWYDQNAKKYAEATYAVSPDDLINQFMNLLPNKPKILDAGCGGGRDTGLLATKGAQVIGLDISKGLLNEARKRNPELSFIH